MKRYFMCKVMFNDELKDNGNNWFSFTANTDWNIYYIEMKRFEEPSQFGISNGRISKLRITDYKFIEGEEIAYDRGWCKHWRKAPKEMQAVYRAVLKKYN